MIFHGQFHACLARIPLSHGVVSAPFSKEGEGFMGVAGRGVYLEGGFIFNIKDQDEVKVYKMQKKKKKGMRPISSRLDLTSLVSAGKIGVSSR